jgi:IS5 family transposase
MRNNFLPVLVGSIAVSFLAGYLICRQRETRERDQWAETLFRQLKDWLTERGRQATAPVQEGLGYARSAAKRASHTGGWYGRQLNPFLREPRRRFLGIL